MLYSDSLNIELEQVTFSDLPTLQELSKCTFFETFAAQNSPENMAQYLTSALSLQKITEEFNQPNSIFYFAAIDKKPIGYLKMNFGASQTELQDEKSTEIERIYVLHEFHGKNVGQLLCDKAIEISVEQGDRFVWLGVWEHNPRAIRFYEKNGFIPFDKHVFKLGNENQTDIMMKRDLV